MIENILSELDSIDENTKEQIERVKYETLVSTLPDFLNEPEYISCDTVKKVLVSLRKIR